jgi:hypothetical protein
MYFRAGKRKFLAKLPANQDKCRNSLEKTAG